MVRFSIISWFILVNLALDLYKKIRLFLFHSRLQGTIQSGSESEGNSIIGFLVSMTARMRDHNTNDVHLKLQCDWRWLYFPFDMMRYAYAVSQYKCAPILWPPPSAVNSVWCHDENCRVRCNKIGGFVKQRRISGRAISRDRKLGSV